MIVMPLLGEFRHSTVHDIGRRWWLGQDDQHWGGRGGLFKRVRHRRHFFRGPADTTAVCSCSPARSEEAGMTVSTWKPCAFLSPRGRTHHNLHRFVTSRRHSDSDCGPRNSGVVEFWVGSDADSNTHRFERPSVCCSVQLLESGLTTQTVGIVLPNQSRSPTSWCAISGEDIPEEGTAVAAWTASGSQGLRCGMSEWHFFLAPKICHSPTESTMIRSVGRRYSTPVTLAFCNNSDDPVQWDPVYRKNAPFQHCRTRVCRIMSMVHVSRAQGWSGPDGTAITLQIYENTDLRDIPRLSFVATMAVRFEFLEDRILMTVMTLTFATAVTRAKQIPR